MRPTFLISTTLLPAVLFLAGCDCGCPKTVKLLRQARLVVPEISPTNAWRQMRKNPDIFLIDVRTKAEYDRAHIPASVLIPREKIAGAIFRNDLFPQINHGRVPRKDQTIFLYCKTGQRSLLAGKTLHDLGFSNVRSVRGGIVEWQREDLPVERNETRP